MTIADQSGPALVIPYVAPARHVLTALHLIDPSATGALGAIDGDPVKGMTLCGRPMLASELWMPVEAREGDRLCAGCESPEAAPAAGIQEALL